MNENRAGESDHYNAHGFDARAVARRFRHSAIFGALDVLKPGEAMRFINDHDPIPLIEQMKERYGDKIEVRYWQREPGAIGIDFIVRG